MNGTLRRPRKYTAANIYADRIEKAIVDVCRFVLTGVVLLVLVRTRRAAVRVRLAGGFVSRMGRGPVVVGRNVRRVQLRISLMARRVEVRVLME